METITPDESRVLFEGLASLEFEGEWALFIDQYFADTDTEISGSPVLRDGIQARLLEAIRQQEQRPLVFRLAARWKWTAAAAAILLLTGGYLLFYHSVRPATTEQPPIVRNDLPPGHNGAILTLSGGETVVLDSAANGRVAIQGATTIQKQNGELSYQGTAMGKDLVYNTLSTPLGRQYQLTMFDGTKVWLNAASSIRYPVVFAGKERKVEVSGEAYFEVAKNPSKPFKVSVNGAEVDVLGTSFNLNAYPDEPLSTTTLVDGAVKVALPSGQDLKLAPGQEARIERGKPIRLITDADVEEATAWKNGRFIFAGNDIRTVMRQLSRWYDVQVDYREPVTKEEFVGAIGRFENISQILQMLEKTHTVTFAVEGRRITVLPYTNK